jgi:hypothetical protein
MAAYQRLHTQRYRKCPGIDGPLQKTTAMSGEGLEPTLKIVDCRVTRIKFIVYTKAELAFVANRTRTAKA